MRREFIGGLTTFLTLCYIIFVQPAVLSAAGMDTGAVMVATCLSSALATFVMGIWAKLPIALAPAMGHNFFFAFAVCIGMGIEWQKALGAVFISGTIFLAISPFGVRERIMRILPDCLKFAIAAGLGFMISLIGCEWGGLVVPTPPYSTYIEMGDLGSAPAIITILGVAAIGACLALKIRAAILIGLLVSTVAALSMGVAKFQGLFAAPPSIAPTLMQLDIFGALSTGFITIIFVFLILDLFDTIGTLVGVTEAGGLAEDGQVPNARQALASDAIGTVTGAMLGTSTVTSYVESAAGISAGAKTGVANIFTAVLFLVALFFHPLVVMVGEPYMLEVSEGITVSTRPVLAPAIMIIGLFMVGTVKRIDWSDPTEGLPAFLTIIFMPFSGFSPTEGIAFGFISYTFLKFVSGRRREVHPVLAVFALLFILKYALV